MVASPTWTTIRQAGAVCAHPPRRACRGSVLFAINQADVVLSGRATVSTWFKVSLTYLVPFCVSNYGILAATHGRQLR